MDYYAFNEETKKYIEKHSKLRDNLPDKHRGEMMQLARTPVGRNYIETEKILQSLLGSSPYPGWRSELMWALDPPVGPKPKASWNSPPYDLNDGVPTRLYIIRFNAILTDGSQFEVYKPGLTRLEVVSGSGKRGRYTKKFSPEVIFEAADLCTAVAWASEQKLLCHMPKPPWMDTFADEVWRWNITEDLTKKIGGSISFPSVEQINQLRKKQRRKPKASPEKIAIPGEAYVKIRIKNGDTEWRSWNGSVDDLIIAADNIVNQSKAHFH
jgi:hypothetical protein